MYQHVIYAIAHPIASKSFLLRASKPTQAPDEIPASALTGLLERIGNDKEQKLKGKLYCSFESILFDDSILLGWGDGWLFSPGCHG